MNDSVKQEEESMEDILSSIRSTVEEEVSKNGEDVAASEADADTADDEVLDLTDIVEEVENEISTGTTAKAAAEESHDVETDLVDIDKFSATGEVAEANADDVATARETYTEDGEETPVEETAKNETAAAETPETEVDAEKAAEDLAAEMLAGNAVSEEAGTEAEAPAEAEKEAEQPAASDDDATDDDDIDAIMAEMASDGQLPSSDNIEMPSEEDATEAMAKLAEGATETAEETTEVEEVTEEATEETPIEKIADVSAAVTDQVVEEVARKVQLSTTPSAQGLQVTFPVEVLAEALRPLVKDWVSENLPDIVQRLVREEFSRLADK